MEAYADRLVGSMHLGKIEGMGRTADEIGSILRGKNQEIADEVMGEFWLGKPMLGGALATRLPQVNDGGSSTRLPSHIGELLRLSRS